MGEKMKKNITLLSLFFFGILILGIATIIPQRSVYAGCGIDPATKKAIPCPPGKSDYSKKNQATNVPTKTPVLTPTDTPKPADTGLVLSQASCPNTNPVLTNGRAPTQPTTGSSIFPWAMGGVGIILGGLIGLLIGGRSGKRNLNGDGIVGPDRGWNGQSLPLGNYSLLFKKLINGRKRISGRRQTPV
jgi:hypothetical protein